MNIPSSTWALLQCPAPAAEVSIYLSPPPSDPAAAGAGSVHDLFTVLYARASDEVRSARAHS